MLWGKGEFISNIMSCVTVTCVTSSLIRSTIVSSLPGPTPRISVRIHLLESRLSKARCNVKSYFVIVSLRMVSHAVISLEIKGGNYSQSNPTVPSLPNPVSSLVHYKLAVLSLDSQGWTKLADQK